MSRILITGSAGLVGSALRVGLQARGHDVCGIDLLARDAEHGDTRKPDQVNAALEGVAGVVHLAAVSRVVWGERDPEGCWETNVTGLQNVLDLSLKRSPPPWLIFASSREVYGQPEKLPVSEEAPLRPMNVYGRSKVAGEQLVNAARAHGLRACIIRLSNVYGSTKDHADRVVPAFARNVVLDAALRVEGADHTFDFTHLDDTTEGIARLVDLLARGGAAPDPMHFVTGRPTTLGQLAALAIERGGGGRIETAPPRNFDVSQFYGSADRARALLDWLPRISIEVGMERLIDDFRRELSNPAERGE